MDFINIGNVKIAKTAALAPMADVADFAFRSLAKKFGASYLVGEMASAKGLCYNPKKTAELLKITELERPMAVQLFGSEPEFMAKAAIIASEYKPDIIDINAGCPVNKVVSTGAGSALMKTPRLLGEIVEATVNSTKTPVTVKIRSGWDETSINAVEIAKICEASGASAITVHGRTRRQMYSGKSDLGIIAEVKKSVNIPVIGNGDIASSEDALLMREQTNCDLVMLGRAALGKPWIFREIAEFLENRKRYSPPDLTERLEIMREHIELIVRDKGEYVGIREARKHAAWYLKGIRGAAVYRKQCMELSSIDDLYKLIGLINRDEALYDKTTY